MNQIKNWLIIALLAILILLSSTIYFWYTCPEAIEGMAVPTGNDVLNDIIEELDTFNLYCENVYNSLPFDEAQRETRANGYECPQK